MNQKKYKHIIWDWNGTLLDDVNYCLNTINSLLEEYQYSKIDLEKYLDIFTFPVKEYYESLGIDFTKHSFEFISTRFIELYEKNRNQIKIFPDTRDSLKLVNNLEIKQSILSAYTDKNLKEIIEEQNLTDNFEYIHGIDNIYASGKMSAARTLLTKLNISSNNILIIGDTLHDYYIAKEFNTDCVLISQGHNSKERLISSGTTVIESLIDLKPLLTRSCLKST